MPTPRVSGAVSVTSRPPRKIAPSSVCSTPATSRNKTVLPAPEGPKIQMISPSFAARDTPSSTLPVLKALLTERNSNVAMALAFHRAERQTLNEVALRIKRQGERRRHRKHDRCSDLSILNARSRHESQCADCHRLFVGGSENQGEYEIIPAEDEGEKTRRRDARTGERHGDSRESTPPRMAGDAIGVLDIWRYVLEIAAHDPENQGQGDQLIDPNEASVGVGQAQLLEVKREGQENEQWRREAEGEKSEGDVFAEAKLKARERIGRRHAQHQRNGDR